MAGYIDGKMWKMIVEKATDWVFSQGVSTVLLVIIIGILAVGVPDIADRVERRIDVAEDRFDRRTDKVVAGFRDAAKSFEADQLRDEERRKQDAELIKSILRINGMIQLMPNSEIVESLAKPLELPEPIYTPEEAID